MPLRAPMARKIDCHHHYFPPDLDKTASSAAAGFRTPPEHLPWTPQVSLAAMDALGIELAILSVPANYAAGPGPGLRASARTANEAMAAICAAHPARFAFWACLGDWRDVDGEPSTLPAIAARAHPRRTRRRRAGAARARARRPRRRRNRRRVVLRRGPRCT
jgi:hypothetical protein